MSIKQVMVILWYNGSLYLVSFTELSDVFTKLVTLSAATLSLGVLIYKEKDVIKKVFTERIYKGRGKSEKI